MEIYGIFLLMGNAGLIPSAVDRDPFAGSLDALSPKPETPTPDPEPLNPKALNPKPLKTLSP